MWGKALNYRNPRPSANGINERCWEDESEKRLARVAAQAENELRKRTSGSDAGAGAGPPCGEASGVVGPATSVPGSPGIRVLTGALLRRTRELLQASCWALMASQRSRRPSQSSVSFLHPAVLSVLGEGDTASTSSYGLVPSLIRSDGVFHILKLCYQVHTYLHLSRPPNEPNLSSL